MAFLKDPKGPPLWEEDPGAKDVVHIDSEKVIYSPSILEASPNQALPRSDAQGNEKGESSRTSCAFLRDSWTARPLIFVLLPSSLMEPTGDHRLAA